MPARSFVFVQRVLILGAAVATATPVPAHAQRLQEVINTDRLEGSLDMDSLVWDGSKVTYKAYYKKPQPGSDQKRMVIATSTIDCATHQRTFVRSDSYPAVGSVNSKLSLPPRWMAITPGSLTDKIQQIVCAAKPWQLDRSVRLPPVAG